MLTYDNIFNNVLEKVPSFAPIYDEHIKDNDELLHHVLMGDLTRYAIRLYREGRKKGDSRSHETLDTILQLLEKPFSPLMAIFKSWLLWHSLKI
jgi:hypothetical protein